MLRKRKCGAFSFLQRALKDKNSFKFQKAIMYIDI